MHVHAPFVRESAGADERLIGTEPQIGRLVDEARQVGQVLNARVGQHFVARLLDRQVGDHRDQVGVAAALADAVDRCLALAPRPAVTAASELATANSQSLWQ